MTSGSTWRVRHEGAALRGKGVAELPASVRAVAEASCAGHAPLAFWGALGFVERFGFAREGRRYELEHGGLALQARRWDLKRLSIVTLARVRRCPARGPPGEEVAPGQWLLEVVARAAEGAHPAAARAIGSFAASLEPPMELEKT
ncbi:hypothetical protein WJX81_003604 [Elliptochloris bilobata]|uniref:Uncharacterized protein n=1 Tax=Elliptochloris bilobata TaxID=381761 RepID=A0AAW1RU82_9CHLO